MKKIILVLVLLMGMLFSTSLFADKISYEVNLDMGWNFISFPYLLEEMETSAFFEEHKIPVKAIWKWKKGVWQSYSPGSMKNTLLSIGPGAYWIYVNQATKITIERPIP